MTGEPLEHNYSITSNTELLTENAEQEMFAILMNDPEHYGIDPHTVDLIEVLAVPGAFP